MIYLLMIQPENQDIKRFRRWQFNNFSQLTIPYLAAFVDERYYNITLIDEYVQKIPYKKHFDLIAITVNTPNATHCYDISARFRETGAKVVMGGPHATLIPDEVKAHCDYLIVGEGEVAWPRFLEEYRNNSAQEIYHSDHSDHSDTPLSLENLPHPRWDLLERRPMMKGAVIATRGCPMGAEAPDGEGSRVWHRCLRL